MKLCIEPIAPSFKEGEHYEEVGDGRLWVNGVMTTVTAWELDNNFINVVQDYYNIVYKQLGNPCAIFNINGHSVEVSLQGVPEEIQVRLVRQIYNSMKELKFTS